MFPGAGNYSGVGVPLDPLELLPADGGYGIGPGMYARILEMRQTQSTIMKSRLETFHKKQSRFLQTLTGPDPSATAGGGEGDAGSTQGESSTLFNVYAGNLKMQLDVLVPEEERLVPDTLSMSLQYARSQRTGEGDGDEFYDEEEDFKSQSQGQSQSDGQSVLS
jgi:hypothetical protein